MSSDSSEEQTPAEQMLLEQVYQLHRHLVDYGERRIGDLGLTMPQAELLRALGSPLPMNQIAGRMHCDASNLTGIVDRLEGRGLVKRRVLAADRRIKEIALTPEGRRLRQKVEGVFTGTPGFRTLHAEEQKSLQTLLARVLEEF